MSLLAGTTLETVARLAGLGVLSAALAAVVAFAYRLWTRETVPTSLAMLVGLAGVAVYLNTTADLGTVIGDGNLQTRYALVNLGAFAIGAVSAWAGAAGGDRYETDILGGDVTDVDRDVGTMVTAVGRVLTVELPEEIDDIVGYDPVAPATKTAITGRRFVFPKRLPVDELTERLRNRLKTDYGVGHVDLDLAADGTVHYLAVGSRVAGIGPTLPPATNAMAIRADPAFAASAGDLVQVWERQPSRHVLTAELRGVSDDVVTVAVDAADTPTLDPTERYRLVTLPVEDRPDREFASLLRAAPETMATVTVAAGSDLDTATVEAVPATVVAIRQPDESVDPIPPRSRPLSAGEELYAIGTPAALRRAEAAATSEGDESTEAPVPPTEQTPAAVPSDEVEGEEAEAEDGPEGGTKPSDEGETQGGAAEGEDAVDEPASEVAETGEPLEDEQEEGAPVEGEQSEGEPPENEQAEASESETDLPGEPDPLELPDEDEPSGDWAGEEDERPSFDDMPGELDEEEPSLDEEEPSLDEEEPSLDEEEPSMHEEEPSLDDEDLDDGLDSDGDDETEPDSGAPVEDEDLDPDEDD